MIEKAGLEWKLRGYPFRVSTRKLEWSNNMMEWLCTELPHGSFVRISHEWYVFDSEEHAMLFALTWAYE